MLVILEPGFGLREAPLSVCPLSGLNVLRSGSPEGAAGVELGWLLMGRAEKGLATVMCNFAQGGC